MRVYKTISGVYDLDVICVGSNYFFHCDYVGLVGIAERDNDRKDGNYFHVKYGNRKLEGGSIGGGVLETVIKRFINRIERKYTYETCEFDFEKVDLSNQYLSINPEKY